jgi:hypothetical protein
MDPSFHVDPPPFDRDAEPPCVTFSTSHIPAAACPGTAQTIAYVPTLVAVNVNVCSTPCPTPVVGFGVAAPGNAGGKLTAVRLAEAATTALCVRTAALPNFTVNL